MSNSGSMTKERSHERQHYYRSQIQWKPISEPIVINIFEFPLSYNGVRIQFNLHKSPQNFLTEEDGCGEGGVVNFKSELVITFPRCSRRSYSMIIKALRSMGVPEHEQTTIITKIYEVVGAVEQLSGNISIIVDIYDEPKPIPVTKSAVEELEKERFERLCAICLEDFEAGLVTTRLRCLVTQYTKNIRNLKPSAQECLISNMIILSS